MVTSPTVSVVMPVYNTEKYVSEAVESILRQTFSDFEFIIVDDGSTDGSLDILRRYAREDSRVQLSSRANTGIVGALNDGLRGARGEFVARMDSDDVSLPLRFERQVDFLRYHSNYLVVGCAILQIDEEGDPLHLPRWHTTHEQIAESLLKGHCYVPHPGAMLRRSCLEQVRGYRPQVEWAEDLDLWLRMIERGRIANLPDVLLHYRIHSTSICRTRPGQQAWAVRVAVEDACRRRGLAPPPELEQVVTGTAKGPLPADHWVLLASRSGYFRTARKHARRLLCQTPFSVRAWIAIGIAFSGPLGSRLLRAVAPCARAIRATFSRKRVARPSQPPVRRRAA